MPAPTTLRLTGRAIAATCKTVAPCGMIGGLTDFMLDRAESMRGADLPAPGTSVPLGTKDFGSAKGTAGFAGSAE